MNQEVGIQDYLTVMNNSITKALLFIIALSTSLIVPGVIAEDIALSCKKNKFKETYPLKWISMRKSIVEGEWQKHDPKKHGSPFQKFIFNEEKGYIDVYFPNPKFNRRAEEVTFRADKIVFKLTKESEDINDESYTIDNYKINRNNGTISRKFTTYDLKKIQITSIKEWEGSCKKERFKKLF